MTLQVVQVQLTRLQEELVSLCLLAPRCCQLIRQNPPQYWQVLLVPLEFVVWRLLTVLLQILAAGLRPLQQQLARSA